MVPALVCVLAKALGNRVPFWPKLVYCSEEMSLELGRPYNLAVHDLACLQGGETHRDLMAVRGAVGSSRRRTRAAWRDAARVAWLG